MSSEGVRAEARGPVQVITIDRPEARNAVDPAVADGLATAIDDFEAHEDARVAILTGAGGNFCAGMDLKAFAAGGLAFGGERGFAGIVERPPEKPILAAVEGFALAGGFEIALACDLVVAARDATFGLPETRLGLTPAAGGLLRLPARIPYNIAAELALTGDPIGAERAYALGLVNRVVEPGTALDAALELAGRIARNGPTAVVATKKILSESPGWPADEAWARQREVTGPALASDEALEGARAFAEKREPSWRQG